MKPLTPEERRALAFEVYIKIYEATESLEHDNIGSNLAYLMGGIIADNPGPGDGIEFQYPIRSDDQSFYDLLHDLFPAHHNVWRFVTERDQFNNLKPHPEHTLKMIVACTNANGEPDLYFFRLKTTHDEVADGRHYDRAKIIAKEQDNEGPFVVWDEDDAPQAMLDLFEWKSASTH